MIILMVRRHNARNPSFHACRNASLNFKIMTSANQVTISLSLSVTHRLFWILLVVGSGAEDPLEVLVGHDQAGLQQVGGGPYGDGGGGGSQTRARVGNRVVGHRHRLSHGCHGGVCCCGGCNDRHGGSARRCGRRCWSHCSRSGGGRWLRSGLGGTVRLQQFGWQCHVVLGGDMVWRLDRGLGGGHIGDPLRPGYLNERGRLC